jgi:hypothetical protein
MVYDVQEFDYFEVMFLLESSWFPMYDMLDVVLFTIETTLHGFGLKMTDGIVGNDIRPFIVSLDVCQCYCMAMVFKSKSGMPATGVLFIIPATCILRLCTRIHLTIPM